MKITTNYSNSDWKRFIPTCIIKTIPSIIFAWLLINLFLPLLPIWDKFLQFIIDDGFLLRFKDSFDLTGGDHLLIFAMSIIFGSIFLPIYIITRVYWIIPTDWIIKKLGIEPRMNLVVFNNGKPISFKRRKKSVNNQIGNAESET